MAENPATPGTDRERLVARWLELTRTVLPGMAAQQGWPISRDHCFMRVFLDHAEGGRWDRRVRRPAIRFMEDAALRRAVLAAEHVVAHPGELPAYNRRSLAWRRA
ncbi:MAG: hypothetical protein ACRYGM_07445 [Janthinobacterium lividum]